VIGCFSDNKNITHTGGNLVIFIGHNLDYYNPQPIHIAQASVLSGKAGLRLALRLEDKGYPGSTYTLDYLGASDLLKGIYYHAGLQQNFPVAFRRINSPSAQ
jgi:hypothetical protein